MSEPRYATVVRPAPADPWVTVALIAALLVPPAGVVVGLIARRRLRRTGEDGTALALTAIVLGAALTVIWSLLIAYFVYLWMTAGSTLPGDPIPI